jgi:putative endonuclease
MGQSVHMQSRWWVYIVQCADGTFYTGCTTDIRRRVNEHNTGVGAKYVRGREPVKLVFLESARDRSAAQKREAEIKKMSRKRKIALIEEV